MTMFSGGVNHPDHQIHTNNNYYNSSSSSSYAFDGASCFFHPINHHRLINYQLLQQQGYENFNHNSCFTTTPHHHHSQAAASAACGLAGISSSSSSDPHPSCNHNLNYNHRMDDIHQEDESRTETDSITVNEELGTAAVTGTSTSKEIDHIQIMHDGDDEDDDHHRHKNKDIQEEEEGGGWLQLSIGSCSHHVVDQINDQAAAGLEQQVLPRRRRRRSITWGDIDEEEEDHPNHHQFLELDLLSPGQLGGLTDPAVNPQPPISIRGRSSSTLSLAPPNSSAEPEPEPDHRQDYFQPAVASSSSSISAVMTTNSSSPNSLFLQQQYHHPGLMGTSSYYSNIALPISSPPQFQDPRALRSTSSENNIIINPTNYNSNINIKSSSLMPPAHVFSSSSYFTNRLPSFQLLHGHEHGHGFISATSPNFGFRVVDPPRRPHSGVWFMLQAALIQSKEPFLPQIPKSYLRIKDGRMTVQFIIKYLVDKLRLDSEAEMEIRCRGQQLVPFLTLQHVRDSIWMVSPSSTSAGPSPMDTTQLTSTSDHLMVLHYGRLS